MGIKCWGKHKTYNPFNSFNNRLQIYSDSDSDSEEIIYIYLTKNFITTNLLKNLHI